MAIQYLEYVSLNECLRNVWHTIGSIFLWLSGATVIQTSSFK